MAVDHVARNMAMDAGGSAVPVDITQIITEAVSKIVADAPEDFDTLKEMSDWIASHEASAAAMNSAIMQNAADIEETNALLDTKPGMKSSSGENAEVFNDLVGNTASGDFSHAEGSGIHASGTSSHAEGAGGIASGNFSHAEGGGARAEGAQSHAEGGGCTASGTDSHAEGGGCTASGPNSHAEGSGCTASGDCSHAEGYNSKATGKYSHAEGSGCTASGYYSHAEGLECIASIDYSHAEGSGCTASGYYSHAEGSGCTANGFCSHAEGEGTIVRGSGSHVQGRYNVEDPYGKFALIIGNGTSMLRHNAFAIDWQGKIYVNGSFTGVDVEDLLNRIIALEEEVAALQA